MLAPKWMTRTATAMLGCLRAGRAECLISPFLLPLFTVFDFPTLTFIIKRDRVSHQKSFADSTLLAHDDSAAADNAPSAPVKGSPH